MPKSLPDPIIGALLAAAVLALAALSGTDASFDIRNYHLYNGYALLHGRLNIDLAPAQLQTFYAPLLDTWYWLLFTRLGKTPHLLNIVLALPQASAVLLTYAIARHFLGRLESLIATIVGATGAAMLPTLATTMTEAPMVCCDLGALLLLLRADGTRKAPILLAGALAGLAVGLKLTSTPFAIALGVVALIRLRRLHTALLFGVAALASAMAISGWWWWTLWSHFQNPVFPYFNNLFHSRWISPETMTDQRFIPHTLLQALLYPFRWASAPTQLVTELPMRDPRIASGWIAVLALCLIARSAAPPVIARSEATKQPPDSGAPTRPPVGTTCQKHPYPLITFWAVSFALWEAQFSIFRYLAPLELLSVMLIALALKSLPGRPIALAAIGALIAVATIYPNWGRTPPGAHAAAITFPAIPPGSLVLLLDPAPMAYVAAYASPGLRFIGVNNNLIHPGDTTLLATEAEIAIRSHHGPIWGLEMPEIAQGAAEVALRYYRLARASGCLRIQSNLDGNGILACPLMSRTP